MHTQRVFRVCSRADWVRARKDGMVPLSPADCNDGFVHLSAPDQIATTVATHFRGAGDLMLLELDVADLGDALEWERTDHGVFPHLYSRLATSDVARAHSIEEVLATC